MSKISDLYNPWDIKYFRSVHKQRQIEEWNDYVSYPQFWRRLEKWMTLRDAIYTPCDINSRRKREPLEVNDQRRATLIENDIQMWWNRLDHVFQPAEVDEEFQEIWNKIYKKPSLLDRFISLFK